MVNALFLVRAECVCCPWALLLDRIPEVRQHYDVDLVISVHCMVSQDGQEEDILNDSQSDKGLVES